MFGRKDSREEEWRNSPGVQLPKATLICESEMEKILLSSPAGTGTCDTSALTLLTISSSSPPLPQVLTVVGCLPQAQAPQSRAGHLSHDFCRAKLRTALHTATPKYSADLILLP